MELITTLDELELRQKRVLLMDLFKVHITFDYFNKKINRLNIVYR